MPWDGDAPASRTLWQLLRLLTPSPRRPPDGPHRVAPCRALPSQMAYKPGAPSGWDRTVPTENGRTSELPGVARVATNVLLSPPGCAAMSMCEGPLPAQAPPVHAPAS